MQGFERNRPYFLEKVEKDLLLINGRRLHKHYFKKWDIVDGKICGVNIFKPGDQVVLSERGKIGWEPTDYTLIDKIEENVVYIVKSFIFGMHNSTLFLNKNGSQFGGSLHPNHFEKV